MGTHTNTERSKKTMSSSARVSRVSSKADLSPEEQKKKNEEKYSAIRKVITLMIHCIDCDDEECALMPYCLDYQDLLVHMEECTEKKCRMKFGAACCFQSRQYIRHCLMCQNESCPICSPLRIIWPEGYDDVESLQEHMLAFKDFILKHLFCTLCTIQ